LKSHERQHALGLGHGTFVEAIDGERTIEVRESCVESCDESLRVAASSPTGRCQSA